MKSEPPGSWRMISISERDLLCQINRPLSQAALPVLMRSLTLLTRPLE